LKLFCRLTVFVSLLAMTSAYSAQAQTAQAEKKSVWKPVPFAILKFNETAPKSWNIYHSEKRGMILVHLWKRYLLMDLEEQEVYDIDPEKIKAQGENVEWSNASIPENAIEVSEWKQRNVGQLERIRFRFGTEGHFLEVQLPLRPDGKSLY
jgi:hypothetical protein